MSAQPPPPDTALLDALIARGLHGSTAEWQKNQPQGATEPQANPGSPPLYGETPGEGYLYAHAPHERQAALVHTDPEAVRNAILRAIEVAAQNSLLPFSEGTPSQWADLMLRGAQAYLLLDPSVDEEGIPVGHQAMAQLAADSTNPLNQAQAQQAQAQAQRTEAETQNPAKFARGAPVGGHKQPPRRLPSKPMANLEDKTKAKTEVLKGARGQSPIPRPRLS